MLCSCIISLINKKIVISIKFLQKYFTMATGRQANGQLHRICIAAICTVDLTYNNRYKTSPVLSSNINYKMINKILAAAKSASRHMWQSRFIFFIIVPHFALIEGQVRTRTNKKNFLVKCVLNYSKISVLHYLYFSGYLIVYL